MTAATQPRVALFVTCLVDVFRPSVGFAALRLLERAGAHPQVPSAQTCCGQPAYNHGDLETARGIARQVIETFEGFEFVVVPSASCAGMFKRHYPPLLAEDPVWAERARAFAGRVVELSEYLRAQGIDIEAAYHGTAAYHDSCSALRELGVRGQPRALLQQVKGLRLKDLAEPEVCCGFGGSFSVEYPEISTRLAGDKAADVVATGADTLLAGELGCLLNIAGRLQREGSAIRVFHYAEILAGMGAEPAIGEASDE